MEAAALSVFGCAQAEKEAAGEEHHEVTAAPPRAVDPRDDAPSFLNQADALEILAFVLVLLRDFLGVVFGRKIEA
jgi:hypothetical protein